MTLFSANRSYAETIFLLGLTHEKKWYEFARIPVNQTEK